MHQSCLIQGYYVTLIVFLCTSNKQKGNKYLIMIPFMLAAKHQILSNDSNKRFQDSVSEIYKTTEKIKE